MQQQRCIVITKNIISIQGCANFLCYTFVLWRYVCSTHQSKVYCNLNWFHHLLLKGSAAPSTCSVEQHLHTNNVFRLNNFPINQLHHRIAYDGKALLPSLRTDHHHHEFPRSSRERTTKKRDDYHGDFPVHILVIKPYAEKIFRQSKKKSHPKIAQFATVDL